MDEMIMEKAAIVPLYYDQVLRFSHPNISGFNSNAMNLLDLKKVEKTNVTNNQ
jgi:peptide/nickel transport system substrate-binding protein